MKKRVLLTSFITTVVLVLFCGLFAIPGQFATIKQGEYSAYEVIFYFANRNGINYLAENCSGRPSAAGIIALIFMLLAVVSFIFQKKSLSLPLLGSICVLLAGILFVSMNLWMAVIYRQIVVELHWLTYVAGAVMILLGGYLLYVTIRALREESHLIGATKSQQYSYLKSNKK